MKRLFILAAAVAMFAACTEKSLVNTGPDNERIPLSISLSNGEVHPATRGINTAYQSTQLIASNTMNLFIRTASNTGAKTATYEQDALTPTSLTNITYGSTDCADFTTSTALYYPDVKSTEICLYAYAPNTIGLAPTTISTFDIDLSSDRDQTADADYLKNDIIWGSQGTSTNKVSAAAFATAKTAAPAAGVTSGAYIGTGASSDPKILIPMQHVASKVIINLIPSGMALTQLQGKTVKYFVDYTKGDLNLATGEIRTYGASASNYDAGQAITLTSNLGNGVTTATDTGAYSSDGTSLTGYTCCAVVLPQKINAGADNATPGSSADLIELYIDSTTSYKYKKSGITELLPGKVYTYNITVTASGFHVTTTVTDWTEDTWGTATSPATGSATLQ